MCLQLYHGDPAQLCHGDLANLKLLSNRKVYGLRAAFPGYALVLPASIDV